MTLALEKEREERCEKEREGEIDRGRSRGCIPRRVGGGWVVVVTVPVITRHFQLGCCCTASPDVFVFALSLSLIHI